MGYYSKVYNLGGYPMFIKKTALVLILGLCITSFCACSSKNKDEEETKEPQTTSVPQEEDKATEKPTQAPVQDNTPAPTQSADVDNTKRPDKSDGAVEDIIDGTADGINDVVDGAANGINDVVDGMEDGVNSVTNGNR